ncbi:N-acyl-aromatic-L-amino acid amidohydrolase (carboxylate-forming) B-like [Limanda limanda]|uniref:N-acyl-aromatic-L-amino acid amidohydrolase (carboxylate-forming) B-like n=1 Tax=Limanda limanda TaxID=27771 RepID=UPI0029C959E7|nr:N-acyl-aromatic-L-amino acid amidohydrolase (carboxylate-forming) B-like [Limanda limanda]
MVGTDADIGTSSPETDSSTYELRRAQELNAQLGPKGSEEAVDLVCDLHNTTSNMGLCIILYSSDWLILHIYKYLQSKITSVPVRAIQIDLPRSQAYSLDSLGKHGFSIEVGPQPHGVLRADIFNAMKEAVDLTIEWLQQFNSGKTFEGGEVETYTADKKLDYPRDPTTNEITAAIHPQLQDNDFKLLRPGDPIFLSFSGETVRHEGEELYPFFVNEDDLDKIQHNITTKRDAVHHHYEPLVRNQTSTSDIVGKMDTCSALTEEILALVSNRRDIIDSNYNERIEKERVRIVLTLANDKMQKQNSQPSKRR